MQRRDFLLGFVPVALAPELLLAQQTANPAPPLPAPVPWTLGLNPKTPLPHVVSEDAVATTKASFFSADQMAALTRLSVVLVPAIGGKPGAVDAEAPAFLDFLIGASPAPRKKLYTGGLDWLNTTAKTKYGKSFAQLDAAQADQLIKPWMRTWMPDHPPTEPHADFLNIAHADIRTATMNSKAWSDATAQDKEANNAGLYWSPIDPDIYAASYQSVHMRPSPTMAAPKSSHTTPSYPQ